ncbi:MAG TPA: hypothetical protein VFH97_06390 [Gemmatimonadales bacterium]|nr:hypothetical protein [Gemmatimonadales bacterium]
MKSRFSIIPVAVLLACGGGDQAADDETARDLALAPAESVAALNDQPQAQAPAPSPAQETPRQAAPRQAAPQPAAPRPSAPAALTLGEGSTIMLAASDTLTSRHNKRGETVTATAASDIRDSRGRTVIPAGSVFTGTITDIAPAESPGGQGRMVLTFNTVEIGGNRYAVSARTDSVGTYMKGRGVTAGDAAKVGAGAVVGAVAGRVIGGDKTGTIVGGVVGTAAGVGIAAATRDIDIILAAGAPIRIVLTAPFTRT